jgi:pimeloyl-ACP methyl ester carboxylesterase
MGTTTSCIGLDSFSSVDRVVTANIFRPPVASSLVYKLIPELFYIDGIATIEIRPDHLKSDHIIIYSQGNGSDINLIRPELQLYCRLFGCPVVSYNYPGYGLCKETPSEEKCYDAISTVLKYYLDRYEPSKILLIGRSLGTGVVVNYAWRLQWLSPIVLISPYTSIGQIVTSYNIDCLFRHNMFRTCDKIKEVQCPVRIIHGTCDNLINVSHGAMLYSLLKHPLDPIWKHGYGHNDIILEKSDIQDLL